MPAGCDIVRARWRMRGHVATMPCIYTYIRVTPARPAPAQPWLPHRSPARAKLASLKTAAMPE
eukprot:3574403-Pleurochrysis_carterae.AAC.1